MAHQDTSAKQFANELQQRKVGFSSPLARKQMDYTRFDVLLEFLKAKKPEFVINAAGYTGKPNVDACELAQGGHARGQHLVAADHRPRLRRRWTFRGDTFRPAAFIRGAKIVENGKTRVEKDLTQTGIARARGKIPARSTASPKRTRRIFPFAIRRAVFTAAPRRWARKPLQASAKVTSGGCGFRSMNSTTRAII